MNITLHVSAITERYLSRRYMKSADTLPPYIIKRNDEFYGHLLYMPVQQKNQVNLTTRTQDELLSHRIDIDVPNGLYRRLNAKRRYMKIGLHLHRVIYAKMIDFIFAQRLADVPAQKALKTFLNYYNIDETEFSLDSAYQAWKRFKRENLPQIEPKNLNFWGYAVPEKSANVSSPFYLSRDKVLNLVNDYFEGKIVKPIYINKIIAYLLSAHSKMTYREIMKVLDVSIYSVHSYVNEIIFQKDFYKDVKEDIQALERKIGRYSANNIKNKAAIIA